MRPAGTRRAKRGGEERQAGEAGSRGRCGPGPPAKPLSGDSAARRRVLPRLPELPRSSGLRPRRDREVSSWGGVEKQARCALGQRGGAGQSARRSLSGSLALGLSCLQPLAARRCSCAGAGAAAAFYRFLMSQERGAQAARRVGQWLHGPRGPATLGGACLTAPPPPASADWRPEEPQSLGGLEERAVAE